MGTRNFWTVNRTQVAGDLWSLGFAAKPIAMVMGIDSPKRVVAKVAHLARTIGLNLKRKTRFEERHVKDQQNARLMASAQLMGDTRTRLLHTESLDGAPLDLAIDILNGFAKTTRLIGDIGLNSEGGIVMRKQYCADAELLEIRAQAVATTMRDDAQKTALIFASRRLAAFLNVVSEPAPGKMAA